MEQRLTKLQNSLLRAMIIAEIDFGDSVKDKEKSALWKGIDKRKLCKQGGQFKYALNLIGRLRNSNHKINGFRTRQLLLHKGYITKEGLDYNVTSKGMKAIGIKNKEKYRKKFKFSDFLID